MNFMHDELYADLDEIYYCFKDCQAYHLKKYLAKYHELNIKVFNDDPLIELCRKLHNISDPLDYEEAENGGFSKAAHELRKEWRSICRQIKRHMKAQIKGRKLYNKEWSKPRQVYISDLTGECHNGLYWTIRAIISTPQLGFKWTKEVK